ncbi:hypothetical protein FNH13_18715 [Ornithinimicrobium ciconiae]|uniref:histidine kinase n=1 Tax=Ornithinimicrobium ciconiae TaxID=2594265 RepID=A0A516GF14_9MICO|nr:histidine kinase [Ornithinimicrobium ciconiae]QDO90106.1 hypothetical protein FNH13_18715 [Ornithinimicrobium ciconiae]
MSTAELEEHGSGPRRIDIPIVVGCAAADLFISGYLTGEPIETTLGTQLPHWPVVALIALGYVALAWRRSSPWPTFLITLGLGLGAGLLLTFFQPMVGIALALHTVARRTPARRANPALVLAAFVSLNNGRTATGVGGDDGLFGLIVVTAIFLGFFTLVWALGRRDRAVRWRAAQEQERLKVSAEVSLGQQRQQIARDLHDILSHSMSAMILQSAGAKAVSSKLDATTESKQVTDALAAIESTGAESMRELHRLLGLLRTQDGDEGTGITRLRLADVDPLIAATRHGGLVVQHHREGVALPLDQSVDLAAYHMVQESLTNAMKHAGRGAVVDIYETWEPDRLQLQVRSSRGISEDDQPTIRPVGSGTGLWGLRERVELAGGAFESGRVEGGFVTSASLPVRATTADPTPTEHTVGDTSDPTEHTVGDTPDPTEHTAGDTSTPTEHTVGDTSDPTEHTVGDTSTPTEHTGITTHLEPPWSTPADGTR